MTNDSLNLRVVFITCDQYKVTFLRFFGHNVVNSRYKRTGRVKHSVALCLYLPVNLSVNSVRANNNGFALLKLINRAYNARAFCRHIINNVLIVDYRPKSRNASSLFKLPVDHFHGTVNAEAKACRLCNCYLTHSHSPPQRSHPQRAA